MKRKNGFTLVEMLVVLVIMGIIAATAVPLAQVSQRRLREEELRADLRTLRTAIDAYRQQWLAGHIERKPDDTGYPPDLRTLVDGVVDASDPKARRLYFLRRVPRDPFGRPDLPPEATWTLRSYDSPASAPTAGKDVYDVMSTSTRAGLDGTPYSQW